MSLSAHRTRDIAVCVSAIVSAAATELDLADALGTSSKIWMNLQATWDLDVATGRRRRAA